MLPYLLQAQIAPLLLVWAARVAVSVFLPTPREECLPGRHVKEGNMKRKFPARYLA